MDKNTALDYARRYAEVVKQNFDTAVVFVYGSYVSGTADSNSDIDVAVIIDGFDGDFLEVSAFLYQLTCGINTAIEPVLLDSLNDVSGFTNEIMKSGMRVA